MTEARQRDQWDHTANVMCLVANCNRDPKERSTPFEPWEFHPLELRKRKPFQPRISWGAFESFLGVDDDDD